MVKSFKSSLVLLSLVMVSVLVMAAISAPQDLVFNENTTADYDKEGNFTVNWTAPATGAADVANYTVYIYADGTLFNETVNDSTLGYTFSNSTDANYTFHVAAVNVTDGVEGDNSTNISIVVDTTNPTASLGTSPADNANSSTAANVFDIKCSDVYDPSTLVLWGNWSGAWAANNTNTSIINDTYSNISVTLSDGVYLWGAYCNDSAGNEDWSANRTLTVDTTDPSATASCTPTSIYEGNLVTCTCTGTDATSGINASLTTATSAIYQGTIGTHTYTCSVTDYSGNSGTATDTYTVIGYGGSYTPTTSYWTGTQLITATQFEESFSKQLSIKERLKMKIDSIYHHVGVTGLTATTATIEIASDPQEAIMTVGDKRKFEVSGDSYYDILVKLNSIENNKADITVQSISELITTEAIEEGEQQEEESLETREEEQPPVAEVPEEIDNNTLVWTIIIIIAIILIVSILYARSKKR